jgi:hypothetical protein
MDSPISVDNVNYITLEANRAWLGVRNMTSYIIEYPKYGGGYFLYDEDFELGGDSFLSPGDVRYFNVREDTVNSENITFTITGTNCTVTKPFDFPDLGQTETVFINSTNDFDY